MLHVTETSHQWFHNSGVLLVSIWWFLFNYIITNLLFPWIIFLHFTWIIGHLLCAFILFYHPLLLCFPSKSDQCSLLLLWKTVYHVCVGLPCFLFPGSWFHLLISLPIWLRCVHLHSSGLEIQFGQNIFRHLLINLHLVIFFSCTTWIRLCLLTSSKFCHLLCGLYSDRGL